MAMFTAGCMIDGGSASVEGIFTEVPSGTIYCFWGYIRSSRTPTLMYVYASNILNTWVCSTSLTPWAINSDYTATIRNSKIVYTSRYNTDSTYFYYSDIYGRIYNPAGSISIPKYWSFTVSDGSTVYEGDSFYECYRSGNTIMLTEQSTGEITEMPFTVDSQEIVLVKSDGNSSMFGTYSPYNGEYGSSSSAFTRTVTIGNRRWSTYISKTIYYTENTTDSTISSTDKTKPLTYNASRGVWIVGEENSADGWWEYAPVNGSRLPAENIEFVFNRIDDNTTLKQNITLSFTGYAGLSDIEKVTCLHSEIPLWH